MTKLSIFKRVLQFSLLTVFLSWPAMAQRAYRNLEYKNPQWTWDLGAAFGSYNSYSYSEIDLGLNDRFVDSLNWRNVLWDRLSSSSAVSAVGVDSSLRFEINDRSNSSSGFRFFAGPGFRVATNSYSGVFGEGGAVFRLGGLSLGAGVKLLNYFSPGKDSVTGATLPSNDFMYFIILAGGGAL